MSGRTDSFVSPTADGSARSIDIPESPRVSAASGFSSAHAGRDGLTFACIQTTSNWGLGGTDTGTVLNYLNTPMWRIRGGCIGHEIKVPFVTTRPAAVTMWRDGLWVAEIVLAYPTNAVGTDNGFLWGFSTAANTRPSVGECFAISNDTAGNMVFIMRGPTGTQTTAIPGITVTALNKYRVELRPAVRDADGTVQVFVNDAGVPVITKTTADANFPAIPAGPSTSCVLQFVAGSGSATDYVHIKDWRMWSGPDTNIGM